MKSLLPSLSALALALALALPPNPPAFILAGDSTTAPQSPDGGGWGTGFLSSLSAHNASHSLHDQRLATIAAAGAACLDLNRASLEYVDRIGSASARAYDLNPGDATHLNDRGGVVFGRMLADLLIGEKPRLGRWIRANAMLSGEIRRGVAVEVDR